jgi:hypothetical protein
MTAPTGIEVEAEQRVKDLLCASTTFQSWIGANVDPKTRVHFHEVIENLEGGEHPIAENRPLALIEVPRFDYLPAGIGLVTEFTTVGGVMLLLESQYLSEEINAPAAAAMFQTFKATVGQIRRELLDLLCNPLNATSFIYFQSITVTLPPTRTLAENRGTNYDFFAVGWRFNLANGGGD